MPRRVNPDRMYLRVADRLGADIAARSLAGESGLPTEADLCRQYGASRTSLREAIKMLSAKGMLSVRPHQGTHIRPERDWRLLDGQVLQWLVEREGASSMLREFMELRISVEPGAAALAARRATAEERTAISAALEGLFAAERGEAEALPQDIAFHLAILNASGNRFYIQFRTVVEAALRVSIRRAHDLSAPMTSAMDHRRIAEPILAGDALAASDAMRAHLQEALFFIRQRSGTEERASDPAVLQLGRADAVEG